MLTCVTLVEHVGTSFPVKGEPDECGTATSKSAYLDLLIGDEANCTLVTLVLSLNSCRGLLCFLSNLTKSSVNCSSYGSVGSVKVVWTLNKSGIFNSGDTNQEGKKKINNY